MLEPNPAVMGLSHTCQPKEGKQRKYPLGWLRLPGGCTRQGGLAVHPSSVAGPCVQATATSFIPCKTKHCYPPVCLGANLRFAIWRAQHAATVIPRQTLSHEMQTAITQGCRDTYPITHDNASNNITHCTGDGQGFDQQCASRSYQWLNAMRVIALSSDLQASTAVL